MIEKNFFAVADEAQALKHNNNYKTNDTSTTVSYAPLSDLENIVILCEASLNDFNFKKEHEYIGTDIKVMGKRIKNNIELTLCVPFIAKYTPNLKFYTKKLIWIEKYLVDLIAGQFRKYSIKIFLNTRDDFEKDDIYLTAIGSAIESGDEGAVGRGNRYNGVIPFTRHMTTEAPCGKNPVYHTGKIFTVIGSLIANEIYEITKLENTVYLTSQMGGDMEKPWQIAIALTQDTVLNKDTENKIVKIVKKWLSSHKNVTTMIIDYKVKVF